MSPERADLDGLLERFGDACRADERIRAGLLVGSHAAGTADSHSDVDLVVVTAAGERGAVWADRETLVQHLGRPLQVEDFGGQDTVFFILADGIDGELMITDASALPASTRGPHRAIHDPDGILASLELHPSRPGTDDQLETLRRQLQWFWHDMAHFVAAVGRGQLWWAAGQLDALRRYCLNLARLRVDFDAHPDEYDKVELVVAAGDLAPMASTFVPLERGQLLTAARSLADYYRAVAPELADAHGVPYPAELEARMRARLDALEG